VTDWLLLEQPGPWGAHALRQSRLPEGLGEELERLSRRTGVRIVLIRRTGRPADEDRHCFAVHTGPDRSWLEHAVLDDPRAVRDLDLDSLAVGSSPGLGPREDQPLFLVCTNGRRDPCCAERGRPLAAALSEAVGPRAWECSHIGGDRFAGNVVCMPHGVYFGRLGPHDGPAAALAYAAGRLDLDHFRGRSCFPFDVQAAEAALRRREHLERIDDLEFLRLQPDGDGVRVEFRGPDGQIRAVEVDRQLVEPPRPLTCHATAEARPRAFGVVTGSETV
jgi:hypothetical protein